MNIKQGTLQQLSASSAEHEESLPLKQVTLYKNELAYLERRGHVSIAQIEVAASVKQLVLSTLSVKSEVPFTVLNKKTAVQTEEEGAKEIFNFQYSTSKNIGGFLSSLIGANVALQLNDETRSAAGAGCVKSGYVMLVEKQDEVVDGTTNIPVVKEKHIAVHLISGTTGCIERIALEDILTVRLLDQHLQEQLIKSLRKRVCPEPKPKKSKKGSDATTIGFSSMTGEEANITVSYLDRATEWKCMYCMEIQSDSSNQDGYTDVTDGVCNDKDQVQVQVIGNVTNSSDEDWTDVSMSLVAN
jgi:hypothetical protein